LHLPLWQCLVANASHRFIFKLKLIRVLARINNVLDSPLVLLDIIAIQKVRNGNVAVLASLYLVPKELVLDEILVAQVVFNLRPYLVDFVCHDDYVVY
jgi:hypothetical protein